MGVFSIKKGILAMIVTIDGPVASGKTSVARQLAKELNMYYLYTGLLYRAVGYVLVRHNGTAWLQAQPLLTADDISFVSQISYDYVDGQVIIKAEGKDVTQYLSDPGLDQCASIVSAYPEVREALLAVQRNVAKKYDIIADGRDCGTVVFPDAWCKYFLTASLEVRSQRLFDNPKRRGSQKTLKDVMEQVRQRDERDESRVAAPLKVAIDAEVIDSSEMTQQETIDLLRDKIKGCMKDI